MRVLVVTAVVEEAEAVLRGLGEVTHAPVGPYKDGWLAIPSWGEVQVVVGGVGPAAAAASTAASIVRSGPYDVVVNAGVAGGFPDRAGPGTTVLADAVVAPDLGAETPVPAGSARSAGFTSLDAMGFGVVRYDLDAILVGRAAELVGSAWPETVVGTVLTVSTVTGSPESTERLAAAHPEAVAEAMEGFGVVTATAPWNLPTLELRTICNPVGVSDRTRWDLPGAFEALDVTTTALLGDAPFLLDGRA